MKCRPLNSIDHEKFLGAVFKQLEALANDPKFKTFDLDNYVQEWYNKILQATKDESAAATYVKYLPITIKNALFEEIGTNKKIRSKGLSSDALDDLIEAFDESDKNVLDYIKIATAGNIEADVKIAEKEKKTRRVTPLKKTIRDIFKDLRDKLKGKTFFKTSIFGTTGSQVLRDKDGNFTREADPEKDFYYDFIDRVNTLMKSNKNEVTIDGRKIRLKVTRRDQVFKDGLYEGRDVLEPDDRAFLAQTGPGAEARMKAFNQGLKVFVTDENGEVLFFDENYKIVDPTDEAGKPIYYGVPTVKKSGKKYTWEVNTPEGKQSGLLDPEFIAIRENSADVWATMTAAQRKKAIKKAAKKQQADLKIMYDLNQKIKDDPSFAPVVKINHANLGVSPVMFSEYGDPIKSSEIARDQFKAYLRIATQTNEDYLELAGHEYLSIPGFGVSVPLERMQLPTDYIDGLIELISNDKIKRKGRKVTPKDKVTLIQETVYLDKRGLAIYPSADGKTLNVRLQNKDVDIKTEKGKKIVRDYLSNPVIPNRLDENGNPRKNLQARWNVPKIASSGKVSVFTVEGNNLTVTKMDGVDYVRERTTHYIQLDNSGRIPLLNGYFTYNLTQEQIAEITPEKKKKEVIPTPEDIEATEEDVVISEEETEVTEITEEPATDPSEATEDINDINTEFDNLMDELDKPKGQIRWERWKPQYQSKVQEALEWYKNSPLSKHFPIVNAMNVVNSNAFATWTRDGITLWAGADHTDLYHEAWHGFSQFFLTRQQKRRLYDAVARTKAGTEAIRKYMKANGIKDVKSLTQANIDFAVEELLAENFRKYMLSGGNPKVVLEQDSVIKRIFAKILRTLEYLFEGVSIADTHDINTIAKVKKLYDELRFLDKKTETKYAPSILNVQPGMSRMNKGIVPFKEESGNKITYDDSIKIVRAVDSVIHETIREQVERTEDPRIAAAIYRNPMKVLPLAYGAVKKRFTDRIAELEEDLKSATDQDKLTINNQLRILKYAVENFGDKNDWLEALQGKTNTGIVAYHMSKSEHFNVEPVELSREELEQFQKDTAEVAYDKAAEEFSILDLANDEIKAIIRAGRQFDEKGNVEMDELGFPKHVDFNKAFATIIKLTRDFSEPIEFEEAFNKFIEGSKQNQWLEDVLTLLGLASNSKTNSSFDLWTKFWQTFYKTVIPHYQVNYTISTLKDERGRPTDRKVFKVLPGRARAVWRKVEWDWSSKFKTTNDNPFIKKNKNRVNVLNVPKLRKELQKLRGIRGNELFFLHAIGLNVTENKDQIIDPIIKNVDLDYLWTKLEAYYNDGNEITDVIEVLKNPVQIGSKFYGSESTNLSFIFEQEARYSGKYPSVSIANPLGDPVYEETQHSSLTRMAESINKANSFYELIAMDHMKHLDPDLNPAVANGLIWLNSIFEMDTDEKLKREGVVLQVSNISGVQTIEDDTADYDYSTKTSQADYFTRLLSDVYSFLMLGKTTGMTPADKGTILSTGVSSVYVEDSSKVTKHLYVDSVDFLLPSSSGYLTQGEEDAFWMLLPYIQSEIDRINKIKSGDMEAVPGYSIGDKQRGLDFQIFDGVFSDKVKKKLLAIDGNLRDFLTSDSKDAENLMDDMQKEWGGFVESEYESVIDRMGALMYLDSNLRGTLQEAAGKKKINLNEVIKNQVQVKLKADLDAGRITQKEYTQKLNLNASVRKTVMDDALIKSYVTNLFIHNIENMFMVFGDLAQYKDFFKRNPGVNSTGYQFRMDAVAIDHINNRMIADKGDGLYEKTFRDVMGYAPRPAFDGTLNTAVFDETTIASSMVDELGESFMNHYIKKGKSKKEAQKIVYGRDASYDAKTKRWEPSSDGIMHPYYNMDEGDAQGWITFDSYKMMSILQGKWSDEQNRLYNKIIAGEAKLTVGEFLEYFPVRKYQYWGPLKTEKGAVIAFHKYSLAPLIPNAIDGKNMEVLHNNMMQQNIDYAVHLSGSKVGTIINQDRYQDTGQVYDQLYADANTRAINEYNPEDQSTHYTSNVIFLPYLKDQLDINSHFKGKVIFSTQLRKLIENGIVENGVPIDYKPEITDKDERVREWEKDFAKGYTTPLYLKYKQHEKNVESIIKRRKEELLARAGWTTEDLAKGTGNLKALLDVVASEMERLEVGDHEIGFLDVSNTGEILHDLSLSPSADKIERVLTSIVNNQLIRQKVNGEPFVQMAATLWEHRGATLEEREKWKQEGLKFYRSEDGRTAGADVKLALHGEFRKLLNLRHKDGKKVGVRDENGNILEKESLARLNETINDAEWRSNKDNLAMITLVGVRIPVQGHNSMEFFHVKEFLPEAAGNIIVPPSEIVAKSGSDFDIDKLSMLAPNISVINGTPEIIRRIDESQVASKTDLKSQLRTAKSKLRDVYKRNKPQIEKIIAESDVENVKEYYAKYKDRLDFLEDEVATLSKLYAEAEKVAKSVNTPNAIQRERELGVEYSKTFAEYMALQDNLETLTSSIGEIKSEAPKLKAEIGELERTLAGISSQASENELIIGMWDILADPVNYIRLVTPNSTNITETKANQMRAFFEANDIGYNPKRGWKKEKGGTTPKTESISPTKTLTAVHNNWIHEINSVGKDVLGVGAVDNTFNAILNRVGAHMNPFYGISLTDEELEAGMSVVQVKAKLTQELNKIEYVLAEIEKKPLSERTAKERGTQNTYAKRREVIKERLKGERRIKIFLDHNQVYYDGEYVVSLSHLTDVLSENEVAEIISQMMNGWVDIAKGGWVFDVQGNKVVSPVLLYLIQAGVDFDTAVDFVSNPIIMDYVVEQLRVMSPTGKLVGVSAESYVRSKVQARNNILEKIGIGKAIGYNKEGQLTTAAIFDYIEKNVTEEKATKAFKPENLTKIMNGKAKEKAILGFLHYLELEEHAKGLQQLKTTMTYDTTKSTDLFQAAQSKAKTEALMRETKLPAKVIRDILNETPIGAFAIQDFQLSLYKRLFPIRLHDEVNDFLIDQLSDFKKKEKMKALLGSEEKFVRKWRNDLIPYIFANHFRRSNADLNSYKGLKFSSLKDAQVDEVFIRRGVVVTEVDGQPVIHIDKTTLMNQFRNAHYTPQGYSNSFISKATTLDNYEQLGLAPVPAAAFYNMGTAMPEEFIKFSVEREVLRYLHKPQDIARTQEFKDIMKGVEKENNDLEYGKSKKQMFEEAYEIWLRDKALDNIFNIFKMFSVASPKTFAMQFNDIVEQYPHLMNEYSVVSDLVVDEGNGVINLKLRDSKLTKDMINVYHENLTRLADSSVMKVSDEVENQRISDFFARLPMFSFFQSGFDTTSHLALTRIVPYDVLISMLEASTKDALKTLNDPEKAAKFLNDYNKKFISYNDKLNFKKKRVLDLFDTKTLVDKTSVEEVLQPVPGRENIFTVSTKYAINRMGEMDVFAEMAGDEYIIVVEGAVDSEHFIDGSSTRSIKTNNIIKINTRNSLKNGGGFTTGNQKTENGIITESLDKLQDLIADTGKKVIFLTEGYGQYMVNKGKGNDFQAKQSFNHLSTELYKRFGFVNPNSSYSKKMLKTMLGVESLDTRDTQLESEINERISKEIDDVIEQMDTCSK